MQSSGFESISRASCKNACMPFFYKESRFKLQGQALVSYPDALGLAASNCLTERCPGIAFGISLRWSVQPRRSQTRVPL